MKIGILITKITMMLVCITGNAGAHPGLEKPAGDELLQIIRDISLRYDVHFTYDREIVEEVEIEEYAPESYANVHDALSKVLAGTNLKYVMLEMKYVIIYQDDAEGMKSLEQMVEVLEKILAQKKESRSVMTMNLLKSSAHLDRIQLEKHRVEFNVTGVVTDQSGEPLIGVNVLVQGTNIGTATDIDGRFMLEDINENATLVFSYIGYQTQEFSLRGRSNIAITMVEDLQTLDEVVVVGYGKQKKINVTGAVSELSTESLVSRPIENTTLALQGTMPGVTILNNTGQPGNNNGTIRIRGIGTLNNSNPMVVVDGVVSSINEVNPNDIERISVMKDAASASIYGSRAANGVILITTKSGKPGDLKINYNGYVGIQAPTRLPDFVPSWQQAQLYNQVQENEGRPVKYTEDDIAKFKSGDYPDEYPNTDWLDLFYSGSGIQNNQYVDLSGGTENVLYMFSLGYFNQQGITKNTGNKRYTTRLNLTMNMGERLVVEGKVAYTQNNFEEPVNPYTGDFGQIVRQVNRIGRNVPYKYSNGIYGYIGDGNPLAWIDQGSSNAVKSHRIIGLASAELNIMKGLNLKPSINYNLNTDRGKRFIKNIQYYDFATELPTFSQGPTSLNERSYLNDVVTLQTILTYENLFNNKHEVAILGGYSQEYSKINVLEGYRLNFLNNEISELNGGPTSGQRATGYSNELAMRSFFGRASYNYLNKYIMEINLRYDGSSRFAPDNRWGLFPSLSAGWNLSEEDFFSGAANTLTQFKLRGSWGKLGNQNIGSYYPYITSISGGQNYSFDGNVVSGIAPTQGANEDVRWEQTTQTNFGIDAELWEGKINFSLDYFNKITDDILLAIPVDVSYGLSAPIQNAGSVRNSGFEINLGFFGEMGNSFNYTIDGNLSILSNEVLDLHDTGPIISSYKILDEGLPINSYYGYISDGIFQTQSEVENHAKQSGGPIAPGDLIYRDLNNDGVIDGMDRAYLGSSFPKATFGLNAGFEWKGLDMNLFFQGAAGVKGFLSFELLGQPGDNVGKATSILLDAWTPENQSTTFPRLWSSYTQNEGNTNPSSFWVRNSSYLRLKNMQVGYTLPSTLVNKLGIKNLRLYYSGQNILTFTSFYDWVDPEIPEKETGRTYPQVITNTIGVNVVF